MECCNNTHQGAPHTGKHVCTCALDLDDASHVTYDVVVVLVSIGIEASKWSFTVVDDKEMTVAGSCYEHHTGSLVSSVAMLHGIYMVIHLLLQAWLLIPRYKVQFPGILQPFTGHRKFYFHLTFYVQNNGKIQCPTPPCFDKTTDKKLNRNHTDT